MERGKHKMSSDNTRYIRLGFVSLCVLILSSVLLVDRIVALVSLEARKDLVPPERSNFESFEEYNVHTPHENRKDYIIELKETPVLVSLKGIDEKIKELENEVFVQNFLGDAERAKTLREEVSYLTQMKKDIIIEQEHKIAEERRKVLDEIGKIMKKEKRLQKGNVLGPQFSNLFNGFVLKNVRDDEIELVRKSNYVKNVFENEVYQPLLYESVPLVNADDAWQTYGGIYNDWCEGADLGMNGNVNILDLAQFSAQYHNASCSAENGWCGRADISQDGVVGIIDLARLSARWQYSGCVEHDNLTGKGIKIAIIDTGVDYTHPDFGSCPITGNISDGSCAKVIGGWDFVNNDADPIDDQGHGTHVAGIAAGNGALKGVAPDAKILAYKVCNNQRSCPSDYIAAAVERAIADGADILSLSLGASCSGNNSCYPFGYMPIIMDNAVDVGAIVVIAAGNSGSGNKYGTIATPGVSRKSITVGASDKTDGMYSVSSRGPVVWSDGAFAKPDVVAPGRFICSAQWDNYLYNGECFDTQHITDSGTSMATPHVSGLVALLKQKFYYMTPEEIKNLIKISAKDNGFDLLTQGHGRIDAIKAVNSNIDIRGDLEFGRFSSGTGANKGIYLVNIGNENLNLSFGIGEASNRTVNYSGAITLDKMNMTLLKGEVKPLNATMNFPLQYRGFFFGKMSINDGTNSYAVYYDFYRG